ncbi:MAG TPA: hypothetical protein VM621_07080 [Luteibacter sp.]|uniref:hypothetical protein n=1 Tax=Luteibacter sp. TaxID=1886636 RepID=UPI002C39DC70|nr:hypothetical protein [Luteibacter sp.]HVI54800.1 hypothetical protein [Luteibacter sp.]
MTIKRVVKETLLVVAEGDAEVALVRHIKALYRDSLGRSVQEANARGKGGKHVLDVAIRLSNNRDHDKVILLLDIDTDWTDAERAKARRSRIGRRGRLDVIESSPCLEAWVLRILGIRAEGDTRHLKRLLKDRIGCEAHDVGWMERQLTMETLDRARETVDQLAELMNHMGIPRVRAV